MRKALIRLFPAVRPGERGRFLLFFGLLGLVTLAQTVGLVGAEAIFLARRGSAALPAAFVLAACAAVGASLVYAAVVGRARNDGLFVAMLAGAGALLAGGAYASWVGRAEAPTALFCGFFVTQAIFANHFWTFASDFFDTLASKRLFPLFMAGSSLGGAAGGAVAVGLSQQAPPEALIAGWAAGLGAAALLLRLARPRIRRWGPLGWEEADETSVEGLRAAFRYAGRSAISRWLVLSALAMVMALFTSQYLYSEAFVRRFPEPARLAAFLGTFLAVANGMELAIELVLTPFLIRRFGVASANLLHPLATFLAFGGLAYDFSLAPAMAARMNRELLENSLAQPVRNLVYNALPLRLRGRVRAFLEGIVVYSGMAVAGAALMMMPGGIRGPADVQLLCLLGAALALLYLAANVRVRSAYLATLVEELREGRLDLRDVGDALGGFEVSRLADLWRELLARPGAAGSAAAALELAPLLAARGLVEPLVFAAGHRDAEVRRASLAALAGLEGEAAHAALLGALGDPEASVRAAALRAIGVGGALPEPPPRALRERLYDADPGVRAEAAAIFGAEGHAVLEKMARSEAPEEVVAALDRLPSALQWLARERAGDAEPGVCAAALRCLARVGAAESLPTAFVAPLVEHPAPEVRLAAVALLGAQGSEAAAQRHRRRPRRPGARGARGGLGGARPARRPRRRGRARAPRGARALDRRRRPRRPRPRRDAPRAERAARRPATPRRRRLASRPRPGRDGRARRSRAPLPARRPHQRLRPRAAPRLPRARGARGAARGAECAADAPPRPRPRARRRPRGALEPRRPPAGGPPGAASRRRLDRG